MDKILSLPAEWSRDGNVTSPADATRTDWAGGIVPPDSRVEEIVNALSMDVIHDAVHTPVIDWLISIQQDEQSGGAGLDNLNIAMRCATHCLGGGMFSLWYEKENPESEDELKLARFASACIAIGALLFGNVEAGKIVFNGKPNGD